MCPDDKDPKHVDTSKIDTGKQQQINESKNISERFGDIVNKGEKSSDGQYAKPFINNEIIQPSTTDSTDSQNTSDKSE